MGLFGLIMKGMSEDTLRRTESKMGKKLSKMNFDSRRHTKLDLKRIDVVNEIAHRCSGKLPKRKRGWYLNIDD